MSERRVIVVGYDAAELLDIACVTTTLVMANTQGAAPPYHVRMVTPGGHPIVCGTGLTLQAQEALERVTGPLDTLIVSGGIGHRAAAGNRLIVAHVRRLARESRRVASVCTGADVLASAGLLDGRRATTHWQWADALAARHPGVTVDPGPIFVRDGNTYTAAGVTSALDLTLSFVEDDHGAEVARKVAQHLVTYLQRPGNQAQMSMYTATPPSDNALVRQIVDHVTGNLDADLASSTLAAGAGVSERHLTRLFLRHLGQTPARFVRRARTEGAAHLLASTSLPMSAVANRCGFGTTETLRQAFVDRYGIPPSRYRSTASTTRSGPAVPARHPGGQEPSGDVSSRASRRA
ncbi:GlxA family transcriptional regulator [Streptosporangium longisporum]|uniref:DJ-1/PfpI family protein n=1 Tax=Streptosporangium longisporum TaxID=46187 RepID=A0ABP6LD55_9ACTN